jgi:hypothetical protein
MKTETIIRQLYSTIPNFTNLFSDQVEIDSMSISGDILTINTATNHELQNNQYISITGARTPTPITEIVISNNIATATTDRDHDLTEGFFENVEIAGSDISDINGTHKLKSVPNRFTFVFEINLADQAINDPEMVLLTAGVNNYNGRYAVNIIDNSSFSLELPFNSSLLPRGNVTIHKNIRISGAVNIERAIEGYTKQKPNDLWLFAILNDTETSKDQMTPSDARAVRGGSLDFRLKLMKNFSLYVVVPATSSISGRPERDLMEDISVYIYKSILNIELDQETLGTVWSVVPLNNGFFDYVRAYYVHEFQFQTVIELVNEDTAFGPMTRAFRDISVEMLDYDDSKLTPPAKADIDLDDEPV